MVSLDQDYRFKVPVVVTPEYTISFSQANEHLCHVHCDIHVPWTRTVKEKLMVDWAILRSLNHRPLYALHYPPDYKHHKFLTLVAGMEPYFRFEDGETLTIMYKTKE